MNRNRAILLLLGVFLLGARVPVPLIPFCLLPVYLLWAYYHPFRPCGRCKGSGNNRWSTKGMSGRCKKCYGSRTQVVFAGRAMHRYARSIRTARAMEREAKRKAKLDV